MASTVNGHDRLEINISNLEKRVRDLKRKADEILEAESSPLSEEEKLFVKQKREQLQKEHEDLTLDTEICRRQLNAIYESW